MVNIKKIIYFLDFSDYIGGSSKVLLTQAYIMKQKGYQVKVVIPSRERMSLIEECDEICRKYNLEVLNACYTVSTCMENINILKALEDYKDIIELLKVDRPNLIHSVQLNIAVEFAARYLGIPHLMNIYQVDKETFNLNWMQIYPQYHSADSFFSSKRWGKGLGIPSRCIRVAYEENRSSRKCIETERQSEISILSIGLFCERKNQLELIKFVLKCKQNNKHVRLLFLGAYNNAYGEKCKTFVDKHKLWDIVSFEGFVLNIEDYLKKADLFILASTVESYPGVIVESMANRVPLISAPIAGIPELVVDEKNGFLMGGFDAKHIYDAFLKYLSFREKGLVTQIVERAYSTYSENHTYAVVGNQLEDYYQWIVEDYYSRDTSYLAVDKIEKRFNRICFDKKWDNEKKEMTNIIWFLYHVFLKINQKDNKKVAIWGAGFWGSRVLEWIRIWGEGTEFVGFIDTNKEGIYLGYPIVQNKEKILAVCGTIFIAVENREAILEIMDYLDRYGKIRNKDYFLAYNSPIRI